MAAALVGLAVGGAQAQVTTEKSASILVFPKVIANGTSDTVIQITNTSNSMVHAHCFYVNGALTFPDLPPGAINPPLWTEVDFDIWLTKQQPTHWVVSQGRLVNAADEPCSNQPVETWMMPSVGTVSSIFDTGYYGCNNAGIDPGRVPPVVEYFTGELKCIEVDPSGAPLSGNHLKGEATTTTFNICDTGDPLILDDGHCVLTPDQRCESNIDCDVEITDVAKYNALGVIGNENNDGDSVLCLGGEPNEQCPNGAEYDACPQFWIANHFAEDAPNPLVSEGLVKTAWTIVPCTQNFETQAPETLTIFIETWNEFEQAFSSFATVTCWDQLSLSEINPVTFSYDALGTSFAQTRLRPSAQTTSGFMMVQSTAFGSEEDDDGAEGPVYATTDLNLHVEGERPGPDLITIPPEQVQ
jgi:hypothetical protein